MRRFTRGGRTIRHVGTCQVVTCLVVLVLAGVFARNARAESPCRECHEQQVLAALQGPHAAEISFGVRFCAACHGDLTQHLATGEATGLRGPAALAGLAATQRNQACLTCHDTQWPGWTSSAHGRSQDVSCWSCHANAWHIEPTTPAARRGAGLCASCHEEQVQEFRRVYHHPVPEGRMSCAACHDVHDATPAGSQDTSKRCLGCHAEFAGPYIFPHRAMDDGCTACHTPHGSVNRSLLTTAGNAVCLTCHLQSNFPGIGKIPHNVSLGGGATCVNCHSEVHGSNVDERMAPRVRR